MPEPNPSPGLSAAFRRIAPPLLLGAFPLCLLVLIIIAEVRGHDFAVDFHHELYRQARDVLHGVNPYPPADADLSSGQNRIWPMAAVFMVMPLAPLPAAAANSLMTVVELASLVGTLRLLRVTDWRIYGATLLWPPTINAIQTGNVTLPLCVLAALVWRYRDRRGVPGIALGAGLGLKFFLWPLTIWLALTRRWFDAAVSVVVAVASLALVLPFVSLHHYITLVRRLSDTFASQSYTVYGFLVDSGVGKPAAQVVNLVIGLAILALACRRRSFVLAIGAALALSPIAWLHFFALLIIPMAIVSPRFNLVWLVPILTWFAPGTLNGRPWQSAQVLVTFWIAIAWCARLESAGLQGPTSYGRPRAAQPARA